MLVHILQFNNSHLERSDVATKGSSGRDGHLHLFAIPCRDNAQLALLGAMVGLAAASYLEP